MLQTHAKAAQKMLDPAQNAVLGNQGDGGLLVEGGACSSQVVSDSSNRSLALVCSNANCTFNGKQLLGLDPWGGGAFENAHCASLRPQAHIERM